MVEQPVRPQLLHVHRQPAPAGVEPTNNRTERQICFVAIDRKVTQGTQGEVGKQWCQRIWTTIATCRQRGKQLYHFLVESIQAKIGIKRCQPSLIY